MNDGVITLLLLSTEDTDYNFLKIGSLGPEIDTVSNAHTHGVVLLSHLSNVHWSPYLHRFPI